MSMYNEILFNGGMFNGNPVSGVSSSDNIVFDNYGLLNNSVYLTQFNDKIPPQKIYDTQNFPRGDGRINVDSHQEVKLIPFEGLIKADTRTALMTAIDEFMKHMHKVDGLLKVTEGGRLRQYTANIGNFRPEQKTHDVTVLRFKGEFQVFSPFGFDESRKVYTNTIITATKTIQVDHEGNVDDGRPIILFIVDSETDMTAITIQNTTTSESLTITTAFNAGDIVIIDAEDQTVKKNGSNIDHTGPIPSMKAGENTFQIDTTSTAHSLVFTIKFHNYYN